MISTSRATLKPGRAEKLDLQNPVCPVGWRYTNSVITTIEYTISAYYVYPMRLGIEARNRALLERLHTSVGSPFDVAEAATVLAADLRSTGRLLRYLAGRGWLSRVRRGLYSTVPLGADNPGAWKEDPWAVVGKVFAPCYVGGWSALEHWSLTEQLFRDLVVFTAKTIRSTHFVIQGFEYTVRHRPRSKHFGTRVVWKGDARVLISDPSRTIIDVLDDPSIGGGIRHVASALKAYWEGKDRDALRLIEYGDRLGNRTVFKRLGLLLETLGIGSEDLITACRSRVSAGLSALDPSVKSRGHILKRWNIRVNVILDNELVAQ